MVVGVELAGRAESGLARGLDVGKDSGLLPVGEFVLEPFAMPSVLLGWGTGPAWRSAFPVSSWSPQFDELPRGAWGPVLVPDRSM